MKYRMLGTAVGVGLVAALVVGVPLTVLAMSSDRASDATVATVVVAARLNSVAQAGDVLVSDTVYQAIFDTFTVEECEEVMVKGLSQPVRPYRVVKAHRVSRKTRVARILSGI